MNEQEKQIEQLVQAKLIKKNLSWNDYLELVIKLKFSLKKIESKIDVILAVSRGGLPVGTILSHKLNKPLAVISVKSYANMEKDKFSIAEHISSIEPMSKYKNILIVDDIIDSGETMLAIRTMLEKENKGGIIWISSLIVRQLFPFLSFYAKFETDPCWITFPYEAS